MKTTMTIVGICLAMGLAAGAEETNAPVHQGRGGAVREGFAQQRQAEEAFRDSLKNMPEGERAEALRKHNAELFEKMKAEMQKRYEEVKGRVEQNAKATADQKKEILAAMDKIFKENMDFLNKMHDKGVAEREKIAADKSMTEEQKREAMQKVSEAAREEVRKHREASEAERKALKDKFGDLLGPEFDQAQHRRPGAQPAAQ